MDDARLYDGEHRMASLVWDNEPLGSGELVKLCAENLGWKKSTTYTVLRKLCDKGVLCNKDTVVTSLVSRDDMQRRESLAVMDKAFDSSLPVFLAAFLSDRKLTAEEAEEIKKLIDDSTEDKQ